MLWFGLQRQSIIDSKEEKSEKQWKVDHKTTSRKIIRKWREVQCKDTIHDGNEPYHLLSLTIAWGDLVNSNPAVELSKRVIPREQVGVSHKD